MNKEFKLLTVKEEQKLSITELKEYYEQLREYALNRKLTNTTKGATTIAPHLKKPTNKIAAALVKAMTNKNVEWQVDGQENIPEGPIILAGTHQGILDNFLWIPEIKQHSILLHGRDVKQWLIMIQLNTGLVFVKKEDKENNHNAKLDMIKLLLEGHSITYFPESTWNMSPNKLHLPLSFGVIDVAKKTGVPIVPVAHEFTYDTTKEKETITKIHSKFGKPIYVSIEDNLLDKLHEYEEAISTLKYELIEAKGLTKRSDISNQDYINFLKGCYKNLALGQLDLDKERRNIFGAGTDFYKFYHINDVPYDEYGNLLETKENMKVRFLAPKIKDLQRK